MTLEVLDNFTLRKRIILNIYVFPFKRVYCVSILVGSDQHVGLSRVRSWFNAPSRKIRSTDKLNVCFLMLRLLYNKINEF